MITAKDVAKAHKILSGVVVNTPLEYDHYLSEKYGAKIYLKKENAQRVRSFKIRGAYFAISQLSKEERERGVVCASAGNHAQGNEDSSNHLHADYNTATKDRPSPILWWGLCNNQVGRGYL